MKNIKKKKKKNFVGNFLVVQEFMINNRLQYRRCRFDPWLRKIPRRKPQQPAPVFLPGESHGREAWWATVRGVRVAKSQALLKQLSTHQQLGLSLLRAQVRGTKTLQKQKQNTLFL